MAMAFAGTSPKLMCLMIAALIVALGAIGLTVIISIIPTFTANGSDEGYGEEYKCPAVMLKATYTDDGDTYSYSSIATNPSLSTLSTSAYKSIAGGKNINSCVMESLYGFGPHNDSIVTARRRRQTGSVGLYVLGQLRCFFSTPCSKQSDKGKYSNSSSLSSCVKDRLTKTNSMFTKSGALTEWMPVPNSFTFSIVSTALSAYSALSIKKVLGIRPSTADSLGKSLGISESTRDQILAGCMYVGQLPQSSIAAIVSSQYTATTTLPSSTQSG